MTTMIAEPSIVLVGLESVGKSALFRGLSGEATPDETNFRGSTVRVRSVLLPARAQRLIDTPGIRVQDDSMTTRLALEEVRMADTVVLVVRGTHVHQEVATLFTQLGVNLQGHKVALAITFADRASSALQQAVQQYEAQLGIPVALVNARNMLPEQYERLITVIAQAAPVAPVPMQRAPIALLPLAPVVEPQQTLFEDRWIGPWLALLALALLFALPVYLAYYLADWAQPIVDGWVIIPLVAALTPVADWSPLLFAILAGDYGLLTLGWYSFLWAFPVVLFISISVALTDESGLKDRVTAALDPWLRKIGLNGRDLIPVLSGFGCNVVAVFQSRACSACTRGACVSLIAFGSACSYQIGASLSLFSTAGAPWLFAPYLVLLFIVGALHTRLWHGRLAQSAAIPLTERAFLQRPTWRGVRWHIRSVLRQFLREAMPIFLLICAVGALLEYVGITVWLSAGVAPGLQMLGLPGEVAPGLIFSIIRKDGLLVLNQNEGALLQQLHVGQVFVLVYLASTMTACLVTLWTIRSELGVRDALAVAGRQAVTALVSTAIIAGLLLWLP